MADWNLFKEWEIKEKKVRLSNLSPPKAFAIYKELYLLQESLPPAGLEKTRARRLEHLIKWRKKMDSLKEKFK